MFNYKIIIISSIQQKDEISELLIFQNKYQKRLSQEMLYWGLANGTSFYLVKNPDNQTFFSMALRLHSLDRHLLMMGLLCYENNNEYEMRQIEHFIEQLTPEFKKRDIKKILAPIDLSTWFQYRIGIDPTPFPPYQSWEPHYLKETWELLKNCHFKMHKNYHSIFFPLQKIGPWRLGIKPLKTSYRKLLNEGYQLRSFKPEQMNSHEVPLLHQLSLEAFSESYLFENIDLATFQKIYASPLISYDFSPSCFLLSPLGQEIGFFFGFYHNNNLIIKSIALLKKYQNSGISAGMIYPAAKIAYDKKMDYAVSALMPKGKAAEQMSKKSQRKVFKSWVHKYQLLALDIV